MIAWPCILKLESDDELIHLSSEHCFIEECKELILSDDDYLVDMRGCTYLIDNATKTLALINKNQNVTVEDMTQLIRAHEFNKAELCLTKIYFSTIADAIESMNEFAYTK